MSRPLTFNDDDDVYGDMF